MELTHKNKPILTMQPKRATLRSDPTHAARYTVKSAVENIADFSIFHRYLPSG